MPLAPVSPDAKLHCQWHHCILKSRNQNEVKHDFFGHIMPLAQALHDAYGIISGTIAFIWSRQLN